MRVISSATRSCTDVADVYVFLHFAGMAWEARLKKNTRQAFGRKRKRAWNARQKGAACAPPRTPEMAEAAHSDDNGLSEMPVIAEAAHSDDDSLAQVPVIAEAAHSDDDSLARMPAEAVHSIRPSCSTSSDHHVSGSSSGTTGTIQGRVDTTFYSADEFAECSIRAANLKESLASQCATARKFELLDVQLEGDDKENGTQFAIVDIEAIDSLFGLLPCPECGSKSMTFSKGKRDYGLCSKLVLACSSCDFREERFSSPRVAENSQAKVRPFEVNLRAMKAMNTIGKGATALTDFFAAMNISHRGLHQKTYQSHMKIMREACGATAAECESTSVARVKELYAEFGNPPGNVDVIYDGTWLTRGHSSHICVGCIIEMYTGLVIDHVVLSNFCLGCATGPKEDEEGHAAWLVQHAPVCQKNVDCKAGQMEVEAALRLFRRSLEKHKLRYTTMLSDGDSRTFHALTEDEVYGYIKVEKKDCINHVHKRMGAALRTLIEKKKSSRWVTWRKR